MESMWVFSLTFREETNMKKASQTYYQEYSLSLLSLGHKALKSQRLDLGLLAQPSPMLLPQSRA